MEQLANSVMALAANLTITVQQAHAHSKSARCVTTLQTLEFTVMERNALQVINAPLEPATVDYALLATTLRPPNKEPSVMPISVLLIKTV